MPTRPDDIAEQLLDGAIDRRREITTEQHLEIAPAPPQPRADR